MVARGWASPGTGGTSPSACTSERLLEKKGRSDGLGVDEMLMVSISGPESLISSSSSNKSAMSVGSMSAPAYEQTCESTASLGLPPWSF